MNFEVEARKLDNKVWVILIGNIKCCHSFFYMFSCILLIGVFHNFIHSQDFFGKSDPYLEFYKQTATGWQLAHRTEVNNHANDSAAIGCLERNSVTLHFHFFGFHS